MDRRVIYGGGTFAVKFKKRYAVEEAIELKERPKNG